MQVYAWRLRLHSLIANDREICCMELKKNARLPMNPPTKEKEGGRPGVNREISWSDSAIMRAMSSDFWRMNWLPFQTTWPKMTSARLRFSRRSRGASAALMEQKSSAESGVICRHAANMPSLQQRPCAYYLKGTPLHVC